MLSIRKGCFETNSSSMHSLAIWKKCKPYDDYYLSLGTKYDKDKENGTFELLDWTCHDEEDYSFYRYPYRQLTTPIEKLRYIVGWYLGYEYPDGDYEKEPVYKFKDEEVEKELIRLIEKYTGYKKVQWYKIEEKMTIPRGKKYRKWVEEKVYPETTFDNDTGEDVMNFVRRKGITLEDLIFKPNYTIQVDGDEYCEFRDMFDFGMINLDNLEDISSGIDFWTRNIYTFYIDEVLNEEYGPIDDCKPYLERVKEELKDDMLIEITDGIDNVTEEHYKVAGEFLVKYVGKCRFKCRDVQWSLVEEYFKWVI